MAVGRLQQHVQSGLARLKIMKNRLCNLLDVPVLILIYHRVASLTSDPQLLAVTPENFLSQMLYLRNNFSVLRFEEDWSGLKSPSVVVTFDDGYADNVSDALPILEQVGVPATFFISTGELGSTGEFWWDELERIFLANSEFPLSFQLRDQCFGRTWPTNTPLCRTALYQELHPLIKQIDQFRRNEWLKQLRSWADISEEGRVTHRIMTIPELKKLAESSLVTIGAHTVSHTPLAILSTAGQRQEIFDSKQQLKDLTGRDITVFSYPFGGKKDYTNESVSLCRQAGFIKAASNFPGQAHRWTDKLQLPRQLVRNWDVETFAAKLLSIWTVS